MHSLNIFNQKKRTIKWRRCYKGAKDPHTTAKESYLQFWLKVPWILMIELDQSCVVVGTVATCNTGIPYGQCFCILCILYSVLLAWEKQQKMSVMFGQWPTTCETLMPWWSYWLLVFGFTCLVLTIHANSWMRQCMGDSFYLSK